MLANPVLDQVAKLLGLLDELVGIAVAYEAGGIVAQLISCGPAIIEVSGHGGC